MPRGGRWIDSGEVETAAVGDGRGLVGDGGWAGLGEVLNGDGGRLTSDWPKQWRKAAAGAPEISTKVYGTWWRQGSSIDD